MHAAAAVATAMLFSSRIARNRHKQHSKNIMIRGDSIWHLVGDAGRREIASAISGRGVGDGGGEYSTAVAAKLWSLTRRRPPAIVYTSRIKTQSDQIPYRQAP
eukprot:5467996-Pleurochrysis_carterae.AAC.1